MKKLLPIAVLLSACGGTEEMSEMPEVPAREREMAAPPAPSFAEDVLPIIQASCIGYCHPGNYAPMSLGADDAYENLVGAASVGCRDDRKRVKPGSTSPRESLLLAKLTGEEICGEPMPPGGSLPAEEIETIREWIAGGAKR